MKKKQEIETPLLPGFRGHQPSLIDQGPCEDCGEITPHYYEGLGYLCQDCEEKSRANRGPDETLHWGGIRE